MEQFNTHNTQIEAMNTQSIATQAQAHLLTPQRHPRSGRNTSKQNQDIDLNLSLDFLNLETPIWRTRRVRRRDARNNRVEAETSGSQKHVVVIEVYLQGLLKQIVVQNEVLDADQTDWIRVFFGWSKEKHDKTKSHYVWKLRSTDRGTTWFLRLGRLNQTQCRGS